ncbi:hypothetical protein EV643_101187 [Kribbella sp. VKM Ac-2527]|uniref:Uncharacterized protein n=1 Tax=Kribbella caucasensis TaxID=2512215 RepID=A0A4R6KSF8_9ACTN|nr:hypothetical protein [Kribbella sp. VKM Ac-2527]TDO54398.1 hypothetical protein EV643_101187 [Kribbella sp. VKM Ac-2527]
MDTDQGTVVLRRFTDCLHGATLLTLHCDSARPGVPFGTDVVKRLAAEGLLGHVLWSTSCTPRDVAAGPFTALRDNGLFLARIDLSGVAGDPVKLRDVVLAVQMLRRLGILVEYELDLFAGSPRFAGVREKVAVLREVVADGTIPAVFTAEPIDGDCSPWLDGYRARLAVAVEPWFGAGGLTGRLAEAWAEIVVGERLRLGLRGVAAHRIALQRLTLRSNTELINLVTTSAREYELDGQTHLLDQELIKPSTDLLTETMVALRNGFLSANGAALLAGGPLY